MEYIWQGSDNKKLSILKELYKNELDENTELAALSIQDKTIVHICNSVPPKDTFLWYFQNKNTDNISNLIEFFSKMKEDYNIKNILIKDASYSLLYGYVHILLNQYNKAIYLRNEHEIDSYMAFLLVEEKIDASS